jgi:hypothetical protein
VALHWKNKKLPSVEKMALGDQLGLPETAVELIVLDLLKAKD